VRPTVPCGEKLKPIDGGSEQGDDGAEIRSSDGGVGRGDNNAIKDEVGEAGPEVQEELRSELRTTDEAKTRSRNGDVEMRPSDGGMGRRDSSAVEAEVGEANAEVQEKLRPEPGMTVSHAMPNSSDDNLFCL
jgi:hypothetical protein